MLDYSRLETGELEPTIRKGGKETARAWGWHPSIPGTGDGAGHLMIELTRGRQRETSRYVVEEIDPLPGLMGRQFRLRKCHSDTVYVVAIGGLPSCTCPRGQTGAARVNVCKHLDAIRALVAAGHLGGDVTCAVRIPSLDDHDAPKSLPFNPRFAALEI
ncbi:MAG: hypothetical protein U0791_23385 [Gemmataceae bacterium]